ncbi:hypothetical protein SSCG_03961 [Streptomyces clavuligerus]|nr:hypothetical protein SSCG_03961 [Streptomyces clavuligerus]
MSCVPCPMSVPDNDLPRVYGGAYRVCGVRTAKGPGMAPRRT